MRNLLRWLSLLTAFLLIAGLFLPVFASEEEPPAIEPAAESVPAAEPAPVPETEPQPAPSAEPAPVPEPVPAPVPEPVPEVTEEEPPPPDPIRLDPFDPGPEPPQAPEGDIERLDGGLHYEIPEDWTAQDVVNWFIVRYKLDADSFAVSFYCPATGERADWNENTYFLAGSTYKLPLNMYYYEQEAAGVYSPNTFIGGMTLTQAHMQSLLWSMNEISHELIYNLGSFYTYKRLMAERYGNIPDDEIPLGFWANNYYSTRFMVNVLTYLYDHLEDFPELEDYLLQAMPGAYLQKYSGETPVLHKYGTIDWNHHDVGILFTEDPCLTAIYTHNLMQGVYGEDLVGRLGRALIDYQTQRTELNRIAAEQEAPEETEAQTEPPTEPPREAPTEPPTEPEPESAPVQTEPAEVPATEPVEVPVREAPEAASSFPFLPVVLIALGAVCVAFALIVLRRRKT